MKKKLILLAVLVLCCVLFMGCKNNSTNVSNSNTEIQESSKAPNSSDKDQSDNQGDFKEPEEVLP